MPWGLSEHSGKSKDTHWEKCSILPAFLFLAAGFFTACWCGKKEMLPLTKGERPEPAQIMVWTGDTEALALLRCNGVVAAAEGTGETDPYPWLYAGRRAAQSTVQGEEKVIYLTFDDGPSKNTGKILDLLSLYGAKATFFVIGENLTETGTEYAKRAVAEGHQLGMHTETHSYSRIYASVDAFLEDYNTLAKRFYELFGECPVCFRFPGGSCSSYINPIRKSLKQELAARGFSCYDWTVSGEDAVGTPTAASIKKNIFQKVYSEESPIILLHDGACNGLTAEVLPEILERLTEEGYVFHTLSEREPYQFPW